ISKAIRSIDAAAAEMRDAATRSALEEARTMLSACLSLNGVAIPHARQSRNGVEAEAVLRYVRSNPGQRGGHIAAALATDTKVLRRPMKRLIEEQKVRTTGERRG